MALDDNGGMTVTDQVIDDLERAGAEGHALLMLDRSIVTALPGTTSVPEAAKRERSVSARSRL